MFVMKIVNTGKYTSICAHSCKYAHICTPRNKYAHMNIYIVGQAKDPYKFLREQKSLHK